MSIVESDAALANQAPYQQVIPPTQTSVVVQPTTPQLVITNSNSSLSQVTIPSTVGSPSINYTMITSGGSTTISKSIVITKDTNGDLKAEVIVTIPDSTTLTGSSWNGLIELPTPQSTSSIVYPAPPGTTATGHIVVEMGSSIPLTFNNAVRILFVGEAKSHVGYYFNPAAVTEITTTCVDDTQTTNNSLPAG